MSTTTPSTCTPIDGALRIPVTLIEPSPLNPRKTWKPERVAAMAADMAANSQIQPIRVRPNPRATDSNGRPPYEIVVGETRWRAAPGAGLATLDAIVADCTDHQLIQLALSENTKRQDLNALEEADAFDALLRKPDGLQGYATVQELAAAVGVSASYVYQRLKLRNLCPAAREAFLAGSIDASVAVLIARMPDQAEQSRATNRIVCGFGGEPYSYRQASEMLKREFMLRLDLARFDLAVPFKVAGPCTECPKRSGAAPDLFADVTSGDMCQDSRCYQAKAEEAHQALLQAARESGRTVLQGSKARAMLRDANAEPVGHFRLDRPCPQLTDSGRPLHALLGQGFAGSIVVVDLGGDVMPVELVPHEVARKAIKARGLLRKQTADRPAAPSPSAKASAKAGAPLFTPKPPDPAPVPPPAGGHVQEGAGETARNLDAEKAARVGDGEDAETLHARVRVKFGELLLDELAESMAAADEPPLLLLRLIAADMWDEASAEECAMLYRVMGWRMLGSYMTDFQRRLDRADGKSLPLLLMLVMAARDCADEMLPAVALNGRSTGVLAKHFGIPLDRVLGDARRAVRAGSGTPVVDATAAFVAAHGTQQPAARAEEVIDEAPAPEWVPASDWAFPERPD